MQGEITQENARIEGEVVEFYQSLYIETIHWRSAYRFPNCPVLMTEEKESMQGRFKEEEVLRCLKMCVTDKAPGPDGFTMRFFYQMLGSGES